MRVLIACEYSARVRSLFRLYGHDAVSCDILPSVDDSVYHIVCDVRDILFTEKWDLVIAFPPCTYLSLSGIHWNFVDSERASKTKEAEEFFRMFTRLECAWCVENPVGVMNKRYRKPDQMIHPWMFGDGVNKLTCLWLNKLKPLKHGKIVGSNGIGWMNKKKDRNVTFAGIALAMGEQWGL